MAKRVRGEYVCGIGENLVSSGTVLRPINGPLAFPHKMYMDVDIVFHVRSNRLVR
jgi:hypothetical protein